MRYRGICCVTAFIAVAAIATLVVTLLKVPFPFKFTKTALTTISSDITTAPCLVQNNLYQTFNTTCYSLIATFRHPRGECTTLVDTADSSPARLQLQNFIAGTTLNAYLYQSECYFDLTGPENNQLFLVSISIILIVMWIYWTQYFVKRQDRQDLSEEEEYTSLPEGSA